MTDFVWSIIVLFLLCVPFYIFYKTPDRPYDAKYDNVIKIITIGLFYALNALVLFYVSLFFILGFFINFHKVELYINKENAPFNSSYLTEDNSNYINDICLKFYGKSGDELETDSRVHGDGYYDYINIKTLSKNVSFLEYLNGLKNADYEFLKDYSANVVKQTESITVSGELKKVITNRVITYHIGDFVFDEKQSGELDGYFGKNISLSIVYNKNTIKDFNHVSDYIIISATEIED